MKRRFPATRARCIIYPLSHWYKRSVSSVRRDECPSGTGDERDGEGQQQVNPAATRPRGHDRPVTYRVDYHRKCEPLESSVNDRALPGSRQQSAAGKWKTRVAAPSTWPMLTQDRQTRVRAAGRPGGLICFPWCGQTFECILVRWVMPPEFKEHNGVPYQQHLPAKNLEEAKSAVEIHQLMKRMSARGSVYGPRGKLCRSVSF